MLAILCKEMMNNNWNERNNLQGNPMLWTLDHLTRVLRSCAGKDGDFMFEKESVKITRAKEFICAPLFKNPRSSTNGWRTAEYKDPKRCAIALGMTHILRPQRTTYVTAWQVGFFERALKGELIHWTKIFHDLIWTNVGTRWKGGLSNYLTHYLVNFYQGMELLTKSEEKRFSKEHEVLTVELGEDIKEEDNVLAEEPLRRTALGLVHVNVVSTR